MAKVWQKSIRINGKLERSPKFKNKFELTAWLEEKEREKRQIKSGVLAPVTSRQTLREYFLKTWLPRRKQKKTKATWGSDEQRFRDYIDSDLGALQLARINSVQIKACLERVVTAHERSPETRTRVRALLSKIFQDARNESKPLRQDNPAIGIQFDDERDRGYEPVFIQKQNEVVQYLKAAKELGPKYLIVSSLGIMAGLRKSEKLGLKWSDFDADSATLKISRRFVQAENKIMEGTKAGKKKTRVVPIPDALVKLLLGFREASDYQSDSDFILTKNEGENMIPRELSTMNQEIRKLSGIYVTDHGLRHTYGRFFVLNSGNLKALQTILGHSNSKTTELYSNLAGDAVSKFRNSVSFDVDGESDE
jgi:integrase